MISGGGVGGGLATCLNIRFSNFDYTPADMQYLGGITQVILVFKTYFYSSNETVQPLIKHNQASRQLDNPKISRSSVN